MKPYLTSVRAKHFLTADSILLTKLINKETEEVSRVQLPTSLYTVADGRG